jgi:lysophospholipase L1-like esterase
MTLTQDSHTPVERGGDLLSRSLFALLVCGLLVTVISLIWLFLAPQSIIHARPAWRFYIIVPYAVGIVLLLGLCAWLLRLPMARLQAAATRAAGLLSRPLVGLAVTLLLLVAAAQAYFVLGEVRADVAALRFLLLAWVLLVGLALLVACWFALASWLTRWQPVWMMTGVLVCAGLLLAGVLALNALVFNNTIKPLFYATSYAANRYLFPPETGVDSQRYWLELEANRQRSEVPYIGGVGRAFVGEYINVSAAGVRQSVNVVAETDAVPRVFFFGGSTMWGYGARDSHTIPSLTAAQLDAAGNAAWVYNLGQNGYVMTSDRILFEQQLVRGDVPDVAVFYQGANDIVASFRAPYIGLPMGSGLQQDVDFSLIAAPATRDPQVFVDYYLNTMRLLRALANDYGVRLLFIWQPMIGYKPLTTAEQEMVTRAENASPGILAFYQQVDMALRARLATADAADVLLLSDLFKDEAAGVFIDYVHISEDGNRAVAGGLVPRLSALLSQ